MSVKPGVKLIRWADLSYRQRAERLVAEQERVKSIAGKEITCCICGEKIKPNRNDKSKYRQSNGSDWVGHSLCVAEVLSSPPDPVEETSAAPVSRPEPKKSESKDLSSEEREELNFLRGYKEGFNQAIVLLNPKPDAKI